jgi:hypothetical protein
LKAQAFGVEQAFIAAVLAFEWRREKNEHLCFWVAPCFTAAMSAQLFMRL